MATISDWSALRSFLAVLRQGSLSGAARATGLTQPTIGRHVERLEQDLGATLFTRSNTGLVPTETALALLSDAEAAESAVAALARTAGRSGDAANPVGTVRISASETMGALVLPAILARLCERAPGLVHELVLSNRVDDILRRDADIAVRMLRPTQDGLVARHVGTIVLGLYAHESYVARHGVPGTPAEIGRHRLVGFDRDDTGVRGFSIGGQLPERRVFAFRADSHLAQHMAIRAGLGIGAIQHALARDIPGLVPVLPEAVRFALDTWLVVHEDQRRQPAVRATFDALADGLVAHVARGEGG